MNEEALECNGYRPKKLTRNPEFKSTTNLFAFHISILAFGKVKASHHGVKIVV